MPFNHAFKSASLFLALAGCLAGGLQSANAGAILSYEVTLEAGYPDVTNIIMLNQYPNDGMGATWAFTALGNDVSPNTTLLTDPFPKNPVPLTGLLLGIIKGLPTDGNPEQKHVVLMMNNDAADLSQHIAWGTLFRNTLEEQLIADIELMTSGQDFPIIQPGIDGVFAFAYGDAQNGILAPGGIPVSAFFTLGSSFTIMSWSDGTKIGYGQSFVDFRVIPEPSSLSLIILGLGSLAFPGLRKLRNRGIAA
jgi:hypothetical protein